MKSKLGITKKEDAQITAISMEFVEMVIKMASSKKINKSFYVSKTSKKIINLLKAQREKDRKDFEKEKEKLLDEITELFKHSFVTTDVYLVNRFLKKLAELRKEV